MNIDDLLDRARERSGLSSDRKLCKALGVTTSQVHSYRMGFSNPSDDTLVKLCKLAGSEPTLYLLELNIERSRGPAKAIYRRLLERLASQSLAA